MCYFYCCFNRVFSDEPSKWNREFRFFWVTSAICMYAIRVSGFCTKRKLSFLIEWMISLMTSDYLLQMSLVTIAYSSGSTFGEAIFFLQGILSLSKIANEEDSRVVNPIFRKILNIFFLR